MKNLKFISFYLLLTLGLASVVFNSCGKEKDKPTDPIDNCNEIRDEVEKQTQIVKDAEAEEIVLEQELKIAEQDARIGVNKGITEPGNISWLYWVGFNSEEVSHLPQNNLIDSTKIHQIVISAFIEGLGGHPNVPNLEEAFAKNEALLTKNQQIIEQKQLVLDEQGKLVAKQIELDNCR